MYHACLSMCSWPISLLLNSALSTPRVVLYATACNFAQVRDGLDDLDFYIGDEALARATTHQISYPIRHGLVENWDHMERLWQRCIFKVGSTRLSR